MNTVLGPPSPAMVRRDRYQREQRLIFWVALCFSLIGLIPALKYSAKAIEEDRPSVDYWIAFVKGFVISCILISLLITGGN